MQWIYGACGQSFGSVFLTSHCMTEPCASGLMLYNATRNTMNGVTDLPSDGYVSCTISADTNTQTLYVVAADSRVASFDLQMAEAVTSRVGSSVALQPRFDFVGMPSGSNPLQLALAPGSNGTTAFVTDSYAGRRGDGTSATRPNAITQYSYSGGGWSVTERYPATANISATGVAVALDGASNNMVYFTATDISGGTGS
jgi:hypothetical protein